MYREQIGRYAAKSLPEDARPNTLANAIVGRAHYGAAALEREDLLDARDADPVFGAQALQHVKYWRGIEGFGNKTTLHLGQPIAAGTFSTLFFGMLSRGTESRDVAVKCTPLWPYNRSGDAIQAFHQSLSSKDPARIDETRRQMEACFLNTAAKALYFNLVRGAREALPEVFGFTLYNDPADGASISNHHPPMLAAVTELVDCDGHTYERQLQAALRSDDARTRSLALGSFVRYLRQSAELDRHLLLHGILDPDAKASNRGLTFQDDDMRQNVIDVGEQRIVKQSGESPFLNSTHGRSERWLFEKTISDLTEGETAELRLTGGYSPFFSSTAWLEARIVGMLKGVGELSLLPGADTSNLDYRMTYRPGHTVPNFASRVARAVYANRDFTPPGTFQLQKTAYENLALGIMSTTAFQVRLRANNVHPVDPQLDRLVRDPIRHGLTWGAGPEAMPRGEALAFYDAFIDEAQGLEDRLFTGVYKPARAERSLKRPNGIRTAFAFANRSVLADPGASAAATQVLRVDRYQNTRPREVLQSIDAPPRQRVPDALAMCSKETTLQRVASTLLDLVGL